MLLVNPAHDAKPRQDDHCSTKTSGPPTVRTCNLHVQWIKTSPWRYKAFKEPYPLNKGKQATLTENNRKVRHKGDTS